MFSDIYRNSPEKQKICERTFSELSKTENRIEKLLLVRFLLLFLFSPIVENDSLFLGHIALSQLILKIMSWNSPDELILILWFQIWNHIFNIKSLWRHYDVILKKLVKRQASSAKIDIYIDSVSQITLFLVGITNIPYFFLNWVKKRSISIYSWKMGPYLLGKRTSSWWRHETMGNIYYVKFNFWI